MKSPVEQIPEWTDLGLNVPTENEIYRHFLITGETGSGKTVSGIQPIASAMLQRVGKDASAALIIDPKGDLRPFVSKTLNASGLKSRLIELKPQNNSKRIWLFEDDDAPQKGTAYIVKRLLDFSDSYQQQKETSKDLFWINIARQFLGALITFELELFKNPNGRGVKNINDFWTEFFTYMDKCDLEAKSPKLDRDTSQDNFKDIFKKLYALEEYNLKDYPSKLEKDTYQEKTKSQKIPPSGQKNLTYCYHKDNFLSHLVKIVRASFFKFSQVRKKKDRLAEKHGDQSFHAFWFQFMTFADQYQISGGRTFSFETVEYFSQFFFMASETYSSMVAVFNSLLEDLTDSSLTAFISLNPFEKPDNLLSAHNAIKTGKIVIYQPTGDSIVAATTARIIKSAFFRAALHKSRLNNQRARPFFYFCDEFQRYITRDEDSGEQSFLDSCRAFRVCCVLATQSIASLSYALPDTRGEYAIKIILNNTGNKLFFRSTDPTTASLLTTLIPEPPNAGRLSVVRVRPPTTLSAGECYYLLANGTCGRAKICLTPKNLAS